MKKNTSKSKQIVIIVLFIIIIAIGAYFNKEEENSTGYIIENNKISYDISNIPKYSGEIFIEINNNMPEFTAEDMNIQEDFILIYKVEEYGMAMIKTSWKKANEDDKKDEYDSITPSGFKQKEYSKDVVLGKYLYHRCHVIGWSLGGIDVDERNLMTGTRDFNIKGMKKFEDEVYNYLKENQTNHVLYRVTPYFESENKLASGVNIEAYSIEDNGKLHFNVYVYNVQDGIIIDYATGESKLAE